MLRPSRRLLAGSLVAVLCVTAVGTQPARADGPSKETLAKPRSVPPGKPRTIPKRKPDPAAAAALTSERPVAWPAASSRTVPIGAAHAAVAGTPVTLGAPAQRAAVPSSVRVDVFDRVAAVKANHELLLKVGRADGEGTTGRVEVSVDYGPFRHAYGADWANRLRLVELPACAPACEPVVLPTANDIASSTVTAVVEVSTTATMLALSAGPSGPAGDFTATPLEASSTWSAGGQSGDFGWSYPMRVPPASAGPHPDVALSYSSQSVDGQMAASNNQPGWIGEGFSYEPGSISRSYKSCSDDMGGTATNSTKTGDLCWGSYNAVLSLSGHSSEIIRDDAEGRYVLKDDDGSKVELGAGATNGDGDGEYWVVTTGDGTKYYFGLNRIDGWAVTNPTTNSAFTVPVFGNNPNEPCYHASFASASCQQAWRWNLDYVVDTHGNTMSLWYAQETNNYAKNLTTTSVATYTRGGYLTRIDYGTDRRTAGKDSGLTAQAPYKVDFAVADRCITAGSTCTPGNPGNWPDVPWDQSCTSTTSCTQYSPTFFSQKRLNTVLTSVWNTANAGYDEVEKWTMHQTYPDPGDSTRAGLWLASISHTGLYGSTNTVPDIKFTGVQMANRVDTSTDGAPKMNWWRVSDILTETGEQIGITYSTAQCVAGATPREDANTSRCYPAYWARGTDTNPRIDWFHRYVVTAVSENDRTGGQNRIYTTYSYGTPAWHYDEDPGLVPASRKTWAQWRGYDTVITTVGDTGDPKTSTKTLYFQGMNGDRTSSGTRSVQITDSTGAKVADDDVFAGMVREAITFNGPGGAEVSGEINDPWKSAATASRKINNVTTSAHHTGTSATRHRVTLDGGRGKQTTETTTTFDPYGMPTHVWAKGDTTDGSDDTCAITTYNRNTTANILSTVGRVQTYAKTCGSNPANADDVISDIRTSFDRSDYGTAPTKGDVTKVEQAKDWSTSSIGWLTTSQSVYDPAGRITDATDVRGNHTLTQYTPATGPVTSVKTTQNPLGWSTTKEIAPGYGLATGSVDVNGKRTDTTYDGIGRMTAAWTTRSKAAGASANATFSYQISQNDGAPTVVTTNTLNSRVTYEPSYAFYDGLLRLVQTQERSTAGGRLTADTFYNSLGQVSKANGPHYDAGQPSATVFPPPIDQNIPSQTVTTYDGAGRTIRSAFLSRGITQWHTTTVHGGDRIDVIPAADAAPPGAGTPTSTHYDALGRIIEFREHPGTSTVGSGYNATTYAYNAKGQNTGVKDGAGNQWSFRYDLLGRPTGRTDPDSGTTTTTYNDFGDVTSTTDASNQTISHDYTLPAGYADPLGRKTSTWHGAANTGTKLATWVYDTKAKGYLTSSSRWVGSREYKTTINGYNWLYQPASTTTSIPGEEGALAGNYTFAAAYNLDGTLNSQSIPATGDLTAETLNYTYDSPTGSPYSLSTNYGYATKQIVLSTQYDQYNQPALTTFADNDTAPWVQQKLVFDDATHRLTQTKTLKSTAPSVVGDISYSYDAAGNVRKAADTPAGGTAHTQCFGYDGMQRLSQAWTPAGGDCATAQSVAALGGAAPYWKSWTFDGNGVAASTGNRRTETTHTATGDRTVTSHYAATDHAHAVSRTTTTVGGVQTGSANYLYDATGNTTSRPGTSAQQTLSWDAENHLASVTEGGDTSSYVYDADGSRLIARDPTGTTLYVGNTQIRLSTSGVKTAQRYYTYNGQTVAQRTAASLQFLSGDRHGTSTIAIANTPTQTVTKRYQDPYGNSIGPNVAWTGTKTFVGGDQDPTNLIHLGAREYDPTMGRFISVDPVQDLAVPQQWNGYAYANNNPTTLSDPSGLYPIDPDLDDQFGRELPKTGKYKHRTPGGGKPAKKKNTRGDLNIVHEMGVNHTRTSYICITDIVCLDHYEVTNFTRYISNYYAQIASLTRGNGGQALADHQYLTAVVQACAEGVYLEANCGGQAYRKLTDVANTANIQAREEAKGIPAWQQAITAVAVVAEAAGGMSACKLSAIWAGGSRKSFSADTPVLMADGTLKQFKDVKVGDDVLATDPDTGEEGPRKVEAVWIHSDDLYTLNIDGQPLITTEDHPFWNFTDGRWERADELQNGDLLRTATGAQARVDGFLDKTHRVAPAYNLTVDDLHTYYVMAGTTPVLVHNTNGCGTAAAGWANKADFADNKTLSKKYDAHAADFGITGNRNKANLAAFEGAMRAHMTAPGTQIYRFNYRGQGQAVGFIDTSTKNMVMLNAGTGKFWTAYRLGDNQFSGIVNKGYLW
ncbi:polymorphic toxin-type HINT domain-containing protein [Paractinoplanes rishiriensis]|nr:polymorphic toxin-type HINT domain-containing protein [Actinoplanes rishiriensis]